jgi:hypothetical protein
VESSFLASCSGDAGSVTGCECVWKELTKRGLRSEAQLEALGEQMRRSFISKGIIAFPPSFKDAILACVPDFRSG